MEIMLELGSGMSAEIAQNFKCSRIVAESFLKNEMEGEKKWYFDYRKRIAWL